MYGSARPHLKSGMENRNPVWVSVFMVKYEELSIRPDWVSCRIYLAHRTKKHIDLGQFALRIPGGHRKPLGVGYWRARVKAAPDGVRNKGAIPGLLEKL